MRRPAAILLIALVALLPTPASAAEDPGRAAQWALDRINERGAGGQGNGVVVAVLDSGVDLAHADLREHILPGIDLVDDDDVAQDANGHGTHVAGIIAATAGNGVGIAGVAPKASILPVRVLDADGSGSLDDVVAGIRWAIAHGADVVNLSLSEGAQAVLGPSLSTALREAWDAGVVPVIAAGNQYVLDSGFADQPALVVSATDRNDAKPSYSSSVGAARWGIAAPGGEQPTLREADAVLSTYWVAGKTDQYAYDCGTSMAAPHVAGAVAVLLGLGLSPQQAVDRLLATAKDIGAPGRDDTFGAGLLDIAAASDGIDPANETPAPTTRPATATSAPTGATTATTAASNAPGPAPTVTVEPSPSTTAKRYGTTTAVPADIDELGDTGDDDDDDPSRTLPAIAAGGLIAAVLAGAIRLRGR